MLKRKEFILERDHGRDVRFTGEEMASADSRDHSGLTHQKINPLRWTELKLFKSEKGNYILLTQGCSSVPGEKTFNKVQVFEDKESLFDEAGFSAISKDLYMRAGFSIFDMAEEA